jgi:hypothetical protein
MDPEAVPPVPVAQPPKELPAEKRLANKVKPTHARLPKPPYDLNTYEGVVADIVTKLDDESKALLRKTEKEDLIRFHHGFGTGIRNHYKFWTNEELVKSCGKQRGREGWFHPDDASMIVIEGVWVVVNSQD